MGEEYFLLSTNGLLLTVASKSKELLSSNWDSVDGIGDASKDNGSIKNSAFKMLLSK